MDERFIAPKTLTHLKKSVGPITACVLGEKNDGFDDKQTKKMQDLIYEIKNDFYKKENASRAENVEYFDSGGYIISKISNLPKFSESFWGCVGLVVSGKSRESGKNISFISHQPPVKVLNQEENGSFFTDLQESLAQMVKLCDDGSIDAVIVGGAKMDIAGNSRYPDVVKTLSLKVKETLGFEPSIINGPKATLITPDGELAADNIYYDTDNKRLYFIRSEVNRKIGNFTGSEVDAHK